MASPDAGDDSDASVARAFEEDRVVEAAQLVAGLLKERLRGEVLLVDERAHRLRPFEQLAPELRQAAQAQAPAAARRVNVDAFEVDALGRLGREVGLEQKVPVL